VVGAVLAEGRYDPTIVVGGRVTGLGANARLGQGQYLVAEADESDGSFLKLAPTIAVVTTIDAEHLDHWASLEALQEAFLAFVNKVPFYGAAVLCLDQPNIQALIPRVEKRVVTYGLDSNADLVARRLRLSGMTSRFEVSRRSSLLGECTLQVPGRHNVLNALAAIGVALELGVPFAAAAAALAACGSAPTDPAPALVAGADAAVVVTEWPELRELPWGELRETMRSPVVIDGRNHLDAAAMRDAGYVYEGMGRSASPFATLPETREQAPTASRG